MGDERPIQLINIPDTLHASGKPDAVSTDFVKLFRTARAETVKGIRKVPAIMETMASLKKGKRYLIEWPEGMEKAVKSGAATWRPRGDGTLPAVIRDVDEKNIVKHLRLREA